MQTAANPPAIQWKFSEKGPGMPNLDIRQVRPNTWSIQACRRTGCLGGRE